MVKLVELAHEALTPKLEPGENLHSVGHFLRTGPTLVTILLHELWPAALKYYFIGVTNKRLIIVRRNSFSDKPSKEENYIIPLTDVKVKGTALIIKLPNTEKPAIFGMDFGIEGLTGMNVNEFLAALHAQ
jgi:hypothetical protein